MQGEGRTRDKGKETIMCNKSKAAKAEKWSVFLSKGARTVTEGVCSVNNYIVPIVVSALTYLGNPNASFPELRQYNQRLTQEHSGLSCGPGLAISLLGELEQTVILPSVPTSEKFEGHSL